MEIKIKLSEDLATKLERFLVEAACSQNRQPSCCLYEDCYAMEHGCLCATWEKAIKDGLHAAECGEGDEL